MARIRAYSVPRCCLLLAMVLVFGEGAEATRSLQPPIPAPSPGLASAPSPATPVCPNPPTINVSLDAYAGVWYEIGSTALIKARTESSLVCITARYSVIPSGDQAGQVRVRNEGYNTTLGEPAVIVGSAAVVAPGRLGVSFFPGAPAGDYRIIYLSGRAKKRYETAIIYSCDDTLFDNEFQAVYVLSRTPKLDKDESLQSLLAFVAAQGIVLEENNQFVLTPQDEITCGRNYD